jgi:hypothetical protein
MTSAVVHPHPNFSLRPLSSCSDDYYQLRLSKPQQLISVGNEVRYLFGARGLQRHMAMQIHPSINEVSLPGQDTGKSTSGLALPA